MADYYLVAVVVSILICNCLILAWVTVFTVWHVCREKENRTAAARRRELVMTREIAQQERTLAGGVE